MDSLRWSGIWRWRAGWREKQEQQGRRRRRSLPPPVARVRNYPRTTHSPCCPAHCLNTSTTHIQTQTYKHITQASQMQKHSIQWTQHKCKHRVHTYSLYYRSASHPTWYQRTGLSPQWWNGAKRWRETHRLKKHTEHKTQIEEHKTSETNIGMLTVFFEWSLCKHSVCLCREITLEKSGEKSELMSWGSGGW